MNDQVQLSRKILIALLLGAAAANGQTVNKWKGDATGGNWEDRHKWEQRHAPTGDEAAHFREANSLISINSTINLNNGMHIYKELTLQGNGNITMQNPVPHMRTVSIPATSSGFANMTVTENLQLNCRVALSAKGFGTAASKGSLTLRDRSNVTGELCIGNAGIGTGQVFVKDSSTYRITELELSTQAKEGGMAEIHVLGGTVRIETKKNPYDVFLKDPSRKVIVGDAGTLRFEYSMPVADKKEALKAMIQQDRLVAAPGCSLTTPVIQNKMMIIRAEHGSIKSKADLISAIDEISAGNSIAGGNGLGSLLETMVTTPSDGPSGPSISESPTMGSPSTRLAGYIVFFGGALLALRRTPQDNEE